MMDNDGYGRLMMVDDWQFFTGNLVKFWFNHGYVWKWLVGS